MFFSNFDFFFFACYEKKRFLKGREKLFFKKIYPLEKYDERVGLRYHINSYLG